MAANARVQTNTINDLTAIQAMVLGIGIEFIKKGYPHCQIGVGKQLDGLGLCAVGKQHRHIFLDCPFQQQIGKNLSPLGTLTHHDTRRVQVVVKGAPFTQKLRRENQVLTPQLFTQPSGKADRNSGFDHHHRIGIYRHHILDH